MELAREKDSGIGVLKRILDEFGRIEIPICLVGFSMALIALSWFMFVSFLFSFSAMSKKFMQHTTLINRVVGLLLIAFGIRILFL